MDPVRASGEDVVDFLAEAGYEPEFGARPLRRVIQRELDDRIADILVTEAVAETGADVSIGVTHAPYLRVLDAMTADGVQLMLAGHTHGGQVCVPYYGALVTNCDLDPIRAKGLSTHTADGRTSYLHVSAGMGSSPFATYRFACPPEATLLTLTAAPSAA